MSHSIYIADDEKNIRDIIKSFLERDGYIVSAFENGDDLMAAFFKKPADLVILDIMMPGTDGLTICRMLREKTDVPIIMLTAKDSEYDYVQGITLGSDDYLTKPFRPTALLMRVHALLRRMEMNSKKAPSAAKSGADELKVGNLTFSHEANAVFCRSKPIELTQTELRMLSYMLQNPDKAYSRDELLKNVWGYESEAETRVTDETLRRIRRKLSVAGSNVSVQTIWGYGYRLRITEDAK